MIKITESGIISFSQKSCSEDNCSLIQGTNRTWKRNTVSKGALERCRMDTGRNWKKRVNDNTKLTKRVAWHSVDQGLSKPHRKGGAIRAQHRSQQSSRRDHQEHKCQSLQKEYPPPSHRGAITIAEAGLGSQWVLNLGADWRWLYWTQGSFQEPLTEAALVAPSLLKPCQKASVHTVNTGCLRKP